MASVKIEEEVLETYKKAFEVFDDDGDGTITPQELGAVLRGVGQNVTPSQLKEIVAEVDYNGDGRN